MSRTVRAPSLPSAAPARPARRWVAIAVSLCIAVVGSAGITAAVAATSSTSPSVPVSVGVRQANAYANSHGVRAGVAVLDLTNGSFYGAGSYDSYFGSASVMKLFVATKLLATGQMNGSRARTAYKMITQSDDASLTALLSSVGGTSVIGWVKSRYGIADLGTTPYKTGCWGNTHITAKGIAYFYRDMMRDTVVAPWLMNALHHHATYGSDGTNMSFGIAAASSRAAVKQGWGDCSSDEGGSIINSTGVVDNGRYAIAILTETMNGSTNGNSYNSWQASIATVMARIILPAGEINLPASHNAVSRITADSATGNSVIVAGWAYDPDRTAAPLTVSLYDGNRRVVRALARTVSPSVNRALHISGGHAFGYRVTARNGKHVFCAVADNVSYGSTPSTKHCISVVVNGRATGALTSASNVNGVALLTGWAWDPDAGSRPVNVIVSDNEHVLGTYPADGVSLAVDRKAGIAGNHAYALTFAPADGDHRYCVQAVNVGSSYSPATISLGCATVTVANDPTGAVQNVVGGAATITVTGWAYDPNAPSASSLVAVSVDGANPTVVPANLASPEANPTAHITGNHGYQATIATTAGQHTVTVTDLNTGPGHNVLRGTYPVTVSAS
jgi:hypothetical protein